MEREQLQADTLRFVQEDAKSIGSCASCTAGPGERFACRADLGRDRWSGAWIGGYLHVDGELPENRPEHLALRPKLAKRPRKDRDRCLKGTAHDDKQRLHDGVT